MTIGYLTRERPNLYPVVGITWTIMRPTPKKGTTMIKKIKAKTEDWLLDHADEIVITSVVVAVGSAALTVGGAIVLKKFYQVAPKGVELLELTAENAALLKNVGGVGTYQTKFGEFFLLHATSLGK